MSNETGIPYDVVAAQAQAESNFNATARSPAGALGWLQFMPGTYNSHAAAAGVGKGTEFNPADEAKVYVVYMNELLKQEHGNLRNALAAYNAGPGNIQAGLGYADHILGTAGQKGGTITTGFPLPVPGLGFLPGVGGNLSISGILGNLFSDTRDLLERGGLILLGAALILLGIHMLGGGSGNITVSSPQQKSEGGSKQEGSSETKSAAEDKSPVGRKPGEPFRYAKPVTATSAVEAAAVA